MIIDLKAIRQKGLCEKDFSFEFVLNDDLLTIPEAKFSKPCKAEVLCEVYPDAMGIKVIMMIYEEADIYFSDVKPLDETVKVIQNRVSTYISERK